MKLSENILKNMHVLLCFKHFTHIPPQQGGRLSSTLLAARRDRRAIFAKSNVSSHQAVETRLDKSSGRNRNTGRKPLKIPGQSGEPEPQFHLALGRASCFSVFGLFSWSPASEFVSQI